MYETTGKNNRTTPPVQARDEIGKMRTIHKGNVLYYETRMEYRIMTPE